MLRMEVVFLKEGSKSKDFQEVLKLLSQLGTFYDPISIESLSSKVEKQLKDGYQLVYVKSENDIVAAAGFVISEKLGWGKHIYIDDFITDEKYRSKGIGTFLIQWLKEHGKSIGCTQIHLDSTVDRFDAHRFYMRNGFSIRSHHLVIEDL